MPVFGANFWCTNGNFVVGEYLIGNQLINLITSYQQVRHTKRFSLAIVQDTVDDQMISFFHGVDSALERIVILGQHDGVHVTNLGLGPFAIYTFNHFAFKVLALLHHITFHLVVATTVYWVARRCIFEPIQKWFVEPVVGRRG